MKKLCTVALSACLTFSSTATLAKSTCENEQKLVDTLRKQAQLAALRVDDKIEEFVVMSTSSLPAVGLGTVANLLLTSPKYTRLNVAAFTVVFGSYLYSFYLAGSHDKQYKKIVDLLDNSIAEQEQIIANHQCIDSDDFNPSLKDKVDAVNNSIRILISASEQLTEAIDSPNRTIIKGTMFVSLGSLVPALAALAITSNNRVGGLNAARIWQITGAIAGVNQIGQTATLLMRDVEARSMLKQLTKAVNNLQVEQKTLFALQKAENSLR